jgi:hypothetical protein
MRKKVTEIDFTEQIKQLEADKKAGYPPNCNEGYVEKDGKCVPAEEDEAKHKKKGYAEEDDPKKKKDDPKKKKDDPKKKKGDKDESDEKGGDNLPPWLNKKKKKK